MLDWLKTVVQTVFRLFPFSTETGLRIIGQPGREAPVFVTCNFDLTVRRVVKALEGLDCYLLVAPSHGINVWCAAGGGMFNAHSVTSVIKTSRIAEKVEHRTVILPQFSAPGIDVAHVERETGWRCRFGPAYAVDITAYVAADFKKTDDMRRAKFPLTDRLEMAVMWAGLLSAVVVIPVAIINWRLLPGVLALIWGFALFLFAFFDQVSRYVPGPVGLVKTLVLGLIGVVGVVAYGLTVGAWSAGAIVGWSLGILVVALVLGFDLDGASPLQAGSTVAYYARKWPGILRLWATIGYDLEMPFTLAVDAALCKGCTTCVEVCPKGVFDLYRADGKQRSQVAHMAECEQCTACVKQCPERAIVAEPPIKVFEPVGV
ncbi:MAG: 4Fe-4S dicluster domain-containing protein [Anaerolineae bacterium]|jgi:NAD-dependent dihydropyrimidine dehydrogenase PreA subunit